MSNSLTSSVPSSIDFWFEFGSTYSYLSVMRIEEAVAPLNIPIRWRPFLLGPIFRSFGWETSPFILQKNKGEYMWKDMARQCQKAGLPWTQPTKFPRTALLPLRVAILAAEQDWMGAYCRRIMSLNFAANRDIDAAEVVTEVLNQLGLPAHQILEEARSDVIKLKLREQTEIASTKGIFGAPMFFVGDEMFWGNDRLDDALALCVRQRS